MRCIVFGTGQVYKTIKNDLNKYVNIVGFLDNSKEKYLQVLDGKKIYNPEDIIHLDYDIIILASIYADTMRTQLISLGCDDSRMVHYDKFMAGIEKGKIYHYTIHHKILTQESCLIITSDLGYHGGAIAAVNAAVELIRRKYNVTIASTNGDKRFIKEMNKEGISFIIYKNLKYSTYDEMEWIKDYKYIVVNTLPMIKCAITIGQKRRVILWLHEALNDYQNIMYWKKEIIENIDNQNIDIYAVTEKARNNFFEHLIKCNINILTLGIKDFYKKKQIYNKTLKIATIGSIHKIKGQDILLDAIKKLQQKNFFNPIYIIGDYVDTEYEKLIKKKKAGIKNINILEPMSQNKLRDFYENIDIIIIPSREETLSIVAIEAMVVEKICIVASNTGIAKYIVHGINGFIFQNENSDELCEIIQWCNLNKEKLDSIGRKARKTYEKFFSMKLFGDKIEKIFIKDRLV